MAESYFNNIRRVESKDTIIEDSPQVVGSMEYCIGVYYIIQSILDFS